MFNSLSNPIFLKLSKMNCWHCNTELIWGGDHDLDDFEDTEYDIITNLTCPKCESYVEVYHKIENKL